MRFRTAAAATIVVALLGACGGGDKKQAASEEGLAAGEMTSTTTVSGSATTVPPSGSQSSGAPGAAGATPTTAAPGSGGTATSAPPNNDITKQGNPEDFPVPLTVSAVKPCVRAGEPQTVAFRTEPRTYIGYDSVYSDGQNSMSAGKDYYGGSNRGETGEEGTWQDTFLIRANAPAGEVRVNAVAANGRGAGRATTTFRVADASGKC